MPSDTKHSLKELLGLYPSLHTGSSLELLGYVPLQWLVS